MIVRRRFHIRPPWEEDYRVLGATRERLRSQCQNPKRECRRNLQPALHPSLRKGRGIRLPKCEAHGAEEGKPREFDAIAPKTD